MSSYVNMLGDLPIHDHLIVKNKPKWTEDNHLVVEFEDECIITNCYYRFQEDGYGGLYVIKSITDNIVIFQIVGDDIDYYKFEVRKVEVGDKMWFYSKFPVGGEYHNGRKYKYAKL